MGTTRRYRTGEHREYDIQFDIRRSGSAILYPERASVETAYIPGLLNTRKGVKQLLLMWRGEKDGTYSSKGRKVDSTLKFVEDLIKQVDADFERLKLTETNRGRRPPEGMPPELLKRRLKAEAILDAVKAEIAHLVHLEGTFKEVEAVEDGSKVLQHGPRGMGVMKGGVIDTMDGQKISRNESGMFAIDDERSSYHGMLVCDYIEQIVKPWCFANAKLRKELKEKIDSGELASKDVSLNPHAPWPKRQ